MLQFRLLKGQRRPALILSILLLKNKIPHALIFTGIEGVGKKTAAKIFAMACNCKSNNLQELIRLKVLGNSYRKFDKGQLEAVEPCGKCKSCRKILSGNHPDVVYIEPSGHAIKIDQIRLLSNDLAMRPYEARLRVVIIDGAQYMNSEGSNALLKLLEEPPDKTILILIVPKAVDLFSTISSRCQQVRFNPILQKEIKNLLFEKHGLNSDMANLISVLANGSYSKAIAMIDHTKDKINLINYRNWVINVFDQYLCEVNQKKMQPAWQIRRLLVFASKLSESKKLLLDAMEIISLWLRDIIIYNYCSEKVVNKDYIDKIKDASDKIEVKSLLLMVEAVQTAMKNIQKNANVKLTIEILLIRLIKVL